MPNNLGEKTVKELKEVISLSGLPTKGEPIEMMNQYWPRCEEYAVSIISDPWLSFNTEYGRVVIGWRKRVINIDWSDTHLRQKITDDNVTSEDTYCHAYGYADAVKYVANLKELLQQTKG